MALVGTLQNRVAVPLACADFCLTSESPACIVKSFAPRRIRAEGEKAAFPLDMTRVRLCFHDRCFDGTASAALFYRFYRERFDSSAEFHFSSMTHRATHPCARGIFYGAA